MPLTKTSPHLSFTRVGDSGPRVLLIMGFGMPGALWKPQVDELRKHARLVYFDNRGVGDSDEIRGSISMREMAKDALRILDELRWSENVHLVGISMGGMIAQELALHAPRRFSSLSLLATHAGGKAAFLPFPKGIIRALSLGIFPSHRRIETLAKLLYPKRYLEQCDKVELYRHMEKEGGAPASRQTMRYQLAAIRAHDTRERIAYIRIPTLIVKPEKDILIRPTQSDFLHREIPNSELMTLPDAGHGLMYQCASELNKRLLKRFLGG